MEVAGTAGRNDKSLGGGVDLARGELFIVQIPAQALIKGASGDQETVFLAGFNRVSSGFRGLRRVPAHLAKAHPRSSGAHTVRAGAQGEGIAGGVAVGVDKHRLGGIYLYPHGARRGEVADEHAGILQHLLEEELVHIGGGIRHGYYALDRLALYP